MFIPGKNWKLSLAELVSFLAARGYVFEVSEFSRAFFMLKFDRVFDASIIADLGGILKIAQTVAIIPTAAVREVFLNKSKEAKADLKSRLPLELVSSELVWSSSRKSLFGVSVYWAESSFSSVSKEIYRFIGSSLKMKLKEHGKKSAFMGFSRDRVSPQLSPIEVLKKGFVENKSEVVFCVGREHTSLGITVGVHNPFEFQKRDIKKPIQRKIFAISPRLAKIVINLAYCTPGKVLLDPFCGVGTILQEALLINAKVIGMDINPWCVEAARKNLEWLKKEYLLRKRKLRNSARRCAKTISKFQDEIDCISHRTRLGTSIKTNTNNTLCCKNYRQTQSSLSRFCLCRIQGAEEKMDVLSW